MENTENMENMEKLKNEELENISSGAAGITNGEWKTVCVENGFLAFRTVPDNDEYNIIGKLYNGDQVQICGTEKTGKDGNKYVLVLAPTIGGRGYVNAAFLA